MSSSPPSDGLPRVLQLRMTEDEFFALTCLVTTGASLVNGQDDAALMGAAYARKSVCPGVARRALQMVLEGAPGNVSDLLRAALAAKELRWRCPIHPQVEP